MLNRWNVFDIISSENESFYIKFSFGKNILRLYYKICANSPPKIPTSKKNTRGLSVIVVFVSVFNKNTLLVWYILWVYVICLSVGWSDCHYFIFKFNFEYSKRERLHYIICVLVHLCICIFYKLHDHTYHWSLLTEFLFSFFIRCLFNFNSKAYNKCDQFGNHIKLFLSTLRYLLYSCVIKLLLFTQQQ